MCVDHSCLLLKYSLSAIYLRYSGEEYWKSLPVPFVPKLNLSNLKNKYLPSLSSRCILTFEVLFSIKSAKGPFKRVNEVDIIFTSYHHTLSEGQKSCILNSDCVCQTSSFQDRLFVFEL